jgi:VTC domain
MQPAIVRQHPTDLSPHGGALRHLAPDIRRMMPTTLARLDGVALLDRVDTKFLLTVSQLASVLPALTDRYLALDIEGRRVHRYRTLYFDTPDFDLYRRHHNGQAARQKVRSRLYVDSGVSFFEIKAKSKRRTVKHRLATPDFLTVLTPEARAFASGHVAEATRPLRPTLRNDFQRMTLVGRRGAERLTLDVNVQFACDGRTAVLPGIAIAEVKQGTVGDDSPFLRAMDAAGIRPTSISKYCVGVGLLVSEVEHDAFDATLSTIRRLMRSQAADPPIAAAGAAPARAFAGVSVRRGRSGPGRGERDTTRFVDEA